MSKQHDTQCAVWGAGYVVEQKRPAASARLEWILSAVAVGIACIFGGGGLTAKLVMKSMESRTVWSASGGPAPEGFLCVLFPKEPHATVFDAPRGNPKETVDRAVVGDQKDNQRAGWPWMKVSDAQLFPERWVRRSDFIFDEAESRRGQLVDGLVAVDGSYQCSFTALATGATAVRVSKHMGGHFPTTTVCEYEVGASGAVTPVAMKVVGDGFTGFLGALGACGLWWIVGGIGGRCTYVAMRRRWVLRQGG